MSGVAKVVEGLSIGAKPTILLVDDEVLVRALFAEELRMAGFAVMEAANGEEALNVLRSPLRVDVVVTDLAMPEMDGEMLVRQLQSEFPCLKVVMVTGQNPSPGIHELLHGYFAKPVGGDRIAEHLQTIVPRDVFPSRQILISE